MIRQGLYRLAASRKKRYEPLNKIELSKQNVLSNFDIFRRLSGESNVIPVLKSNAYGHGLPEIARILNEVPCELLAVDGYFEANSIKHITKHRILVLGYVKPINVRHLDVKKCSFVVQDIAGLEAFGKLGKNIQIHIELNTGMNRLGLSQAELGDYLAALRKHPKLELEGVMTHLADADNATDDTVINEQSESFDRMLEQIRTAGYSPKYIHIAQTAGSTKLINSNANAIRLGIGLYGINPLATTDKHYQNLSDLKPALTLKSTIIKTIELEKGDKVSYNGTFVAPKKMRIGVLPLGYYEGVPRELSNVGAVTSEGVVLPIVGKVCMNHTMVDLRGGEVGTGDEVVVINGDALAPNSIQTISNRYNLFAYGLVTKLSSSIRREII